MKLPRLILSSAMAVGLVCGLAVAALARPGILTGQQPGSRINVRSRPTVNAPAPHYGLVGDRVEILNQTQGTDGYTWYYVQFASGAEGWVRGDFVRPANTTRTGILTGAQPGSRVNVRSAPSTSAASPHYGLVGDRVQILRSTQGRDNYIWYYVQFDSGAKGWVRGDLVRLLN